MPKLKPQTKFLLRGSALLICLLSLWWFVLVNPMVSVLEGVSGVAGRLVFGSTGSDLITETEARDWTFHVPLEMTIPAIGPRPAQQIHSIDFDMPRADVIAFTFSLPVFWAIVLAAPGWLRNLRPLAIGTGIMAGAELIMLLVFAQVSARRAALQLATGGSVTDTWILHFLEYLTVSVLPYALPFVVALAVHPVLREQILQWSAGAGTPVPSAPAPPARRKGRAG